MEFECVECGALMEVGDPPRGEWLALWHEDANGDMERSWVFIFSEESA